MLWNMTMLELFKIAVVVVCASRDAGGVPLPFPYSSNARQTAAVPQL